MIIIHSNDENPKERKVPYLVYRKWSSSGGGSSGGRGRGGSECSTCGLVTSLLTYDLLITPETWLSIHGRPWLSCTRHVVSMLLIVMFCCSVERAT